jgi:methylmalonyl-CoA mutase C-terminal domain/subunit
LGRSSIAHRELLEARTGRGPSLSPPASLCRSGRSGPSGAHAEQPRPQGVGRLARVPGKYRIIVAKPGLDGHDRGVKVIARSLRDAGFEVIYTGLHQTPEQIAETTIQEDADAVGLSCHSGAHMTLFPKVVTLLRDKGAGDVVVFGGGIIPKDDIPKLQEAGIERIFTPGASTGEIVEWLNERLSDQLPDHRAS